MKHAKDIKIYMKKKNIKGEKSPETYQNLSEEMNVILQSHHERNNNLSEEGKQ